MRRLPLRPARPVQGLFRFHGRITLLSAGIVAAAAVTAGLALSRSAPIGTGVVVIDTNLALDGGKAAATGMVLNPSGEILTNNHVIGGATSIKIVVPGTGHSYAAEVVGYDVSADVAVLHAISARDLKTIATDSSSRLKVGQSVTAVGNAGGIGSLTSGTGRVTALGRSFTAVSDDQGGSESLAGLVQTNAPLQPGDSGGPLLDAAGRAIAMDTAGSAAYGSAARASGPGYAIPIDEPLAIARQIESGHGSTAVHIGSTAFLGVAVLSTLGNAPDGSAATGATIAEVTRSGPAAAAGLVAGDIITAIGGRVVPTPNALGALIVSRKPGGRVLVKYTDHSGSSHTTTVRLASGPPQ